MSERATRKSMGGVWGFLGAATIGMGVVSCSGSKPAPTPPAFAGSITLEAAEERARAEGRVVVAVATADWCAPCQSYKRGALSDAPVNAWLEAHAVPVLIDVTKGMTPDAERLGVSPIPATFVLRDGEIVAQHAGVLTSQKLMRMLESASAQ